jgi:hypothetical protein
MLQSGVGTQDLDVRWVSSLSWYFLTLFGLQPVYNFILGSNNGECLSRDSRLSGADFYFQLQAMSHSRWVCRTLVRVWV